METEDVVFAAGNAGDNPGAPEPLNLNGSFRNDVLDSGPAGGLNVGYKERTLPEEGGHEASELEGVGLGATRSSIFEGGDEGKGEGERPVQCTAGNMEAILELEQMPSGGISNAAQDMVIDTVMKNTEIESKFEGQASMMTREKVTDVVMKDVVNEAATDVSLPVEVVAVGSGEIHSVQVGTTADLSKRSDTKINGSVSSSLNLSSEVTNANEAEESLMDSRVLVQKAETARNGDGMMENLENLTAIQESRKDTDKYRIASSSIAEVLAAGVAAGVAEGIAESIAETIAKETAGSCGQGSMEGRPFDSARFERMAIAKAVAEVIAESVAQEVAQGLADGLAEAAATAEAFNGSVTEAFDEVEKRKPDNILGTALDNKDGVVCDCGLVAVVRVVGEKSPNRGLRYLMCPLQEPSFFKRKGKRKESDTIGKCKFFRWLDTPRHPSKEDKKKEKAKAHTEDINVSHLTRASAKKSNLELPSAVGNKPSGGEVPPSEISTPRKTDDNLQLPVVPESTPDMKVKPVRQQRKRGPAEESGRDDVLAADWPTSAGTLTRSALRKGAPEPVQEPSLDTTAVSTPPSALGKRTIDWTDNYVGPESQVFEKGATWRKRRSVRGESGPSSRYSIGGSGSGRNTGFGSSEKKPLHYSRRQTGQIGASDGETTNLLSSPNPLADVESAGIGNKDEEDNRFKSYYKKGKVGSTLELKPAEEISPVETEMKSKSQTRRQQRKLPLSEVYGAMEPLLPVKPTKKGTTIFVSNDNSLSPSGQSLGKSTPSDVASEPKEAELSKSPPKKRKLSWVLSEDSVVREIDSPRRTSARRSNSSAPTNSGSQNLSSTIVETPLRASVFPTVRYEAKLPSEDYHDPDDPWSLEIPWAKQEQQREEAQKLEREKEKETRKDEREGVSEEGEEMDAGMSIEAVNETAAAEEELPTKVLNAAQSSSVPEPGKFTVVENSAVVPAPVSSNMNLDEAGEKQSDTSGPHLDQETINAIGDTGISLVDAVDGGENISLACASPAGGAHPKLLADGQEVGDVLKEDPKESHEVLRDEQTLDDKSQTSMLAAQTGTQLEADGHESLMSETAIMKVPGSIDESNHCAPDKPDSTAPLEQLSIKEGAENFTNDCTQSVNVGELIVEDVVNLDNNLLIGSVPAVSKNSSSKLDDAMETDTILPCERSEPRVLSGDAETTNERELVLSGDKHENEVYQESVKRTDGQIEEPAVSGSNLVGDSRLHARAGQVSNHEPERDLAHTPLDQDAAFKSPRETDPAGAAAASENAGFVNAVWRLASGKKTRSVGSIGAPALTSKRSRSVVPSQKGGPKGDPKHQVEIQWVDVPLDWRNEKSTSRAPLLPNFSGKGLNGSDTSQSDLRLLQSGDTSQGTHSARPRLARGEVDDSSIITDEKEKGHEPCNEDSTDLHAQITNGATHAAFGSMAAGDEASVPAGENYPAGHTNQEAVFAGGENAVQKRKRGRPRKDSKKLVGLQYPVAGGHKLGAAVGVNQSPEPELAGVVGKADGEPSSMLICSTAMQGNTLTELHGEDKVSQLERSASNTERENGKPEGTSSGPEECGRPLDGSDIPSASTEGLHSEIVAPYCLCKVVPREAILSVTRSGDPNEGLRYWSCSNNRRLFKKKGKSPSEVTEERCNYFRWLDTPRVTAKDMREARKERYRQVELQRLL